MKKVIVISAMLIFGGIGIAQADYKEDVKKAVNQELVNFFQAEQGNRLTAYSFKTLIQNIDGIFAKGKAKPIAAPKVVPESKVE